MNKLPTKQIYLLFIIVVGLIALSVYSTYALFTFENSTSDIVSIHIPKSLTISENIYEYQQVVVKPNTITTTDIDIYNSFEYEVCYSVWYKVLGETDIQNKIQIFEQNKDTLTSSGTLKPTTNIRVSLVIINDNENEVKINLGTIGKQKTDGSCSLNITNDKSVVTTSYKNIDILTSKLIEETKETELKESYLTYKDEKEIITYKDIDKIYTSEKYTYKNETFILEDAKDITMNDLINQNTMQSKDIYFCKENNKCKILYKFRIENISKEATNQQTIYHINKYDKLIGYSEGKNGLRKINDTDYVYYGDNPNNFIYYNCNNNDDLSTCELWRIVGFFYNKETKEYSTKIVRNKSIGKHQYDYKMVDNTNQSSNDWNNSTLYKYLNEEYKLINNNDIYIDKYLGQIERIPSLEIDIKNMKIPDETTDGEISLLYLSDYLHTSSCQNNKINEYTNNCLSSNWLYNIEIPKEWTLTSKEVEKIIEENIIVDNLEEEPTTEEEKDTENTKEEVVEEEKPTEVVEENNYVINYVYTIGENISADDINESYHVRPVVFLKSRILLLDGDGSLETPYVVK